MKKNRLYFLWLILLSVSCIENDQNRKELCFNSFEIVNESLVARHMVIKLDTIKRFKIVESVFIDSVGSWELDTLKDGGIRFLLKFDSVERGRLAIENELHLLDNNYYQPLIASPTLLKNWNGQLRVFYVSKDNVSEGNGDSYEE